MTRRIKYHSLHFLFRLFAYLADKSGGWYVFVKPKLVLGALLISITAYGQASKPIKTVSTVEKDKQAKADTMKAVVKEESIFCYVTEQMPTYPGGDQELLNFIAKNLKYPTTALARKIQGKVFVRFVVTEVGKVDKVEVMRSLDPACDAEAIRVVKLLSRWTPGKQDGKNTAVYYTLPITFRREK